MLKLFNNTVFFYVTGCVQLVKMFIFWREQESTSIRNSIFEQ